MRASSCIMTLDARDVHVCVDVCMQVCRQLCIDPDAANHPCSNPCRCDRLAKVRFGDVSER